MTVSFILESNFARLLLVVVIDLVLSFMLYILWLAFYS